MANKFGAETAFKTVANNFEEVGQEYQLIRDFKFVPGEQVNILSITTTRDHTYLLSSKRKAKKRGSDDCAQGGPRNY